MSLTKETRRESYEKVLEELGNKQMLVYEHLQYFERGITAKELAVAMHSLGLVASSERNSVHPRLNELVEKDLVEIIGKKVCEYTGRKVAIYKSKY